MLEQLPEGDGIAAKYPGDLGIEADPEVVFADGFEDIDGDTIATGREEQKGNRWDTAWHTVRITQEPENVHSGRKAVEMAHVEPMSHGASKDFPDGLDTLFVRYYMKYHKDFPGCHHTGMYVWAGAPGVILASGTDHSATGVQPDGQNHFVVGLDASRPRRRSDILPPGQMEIYCYHMDQGRRWGDLFFPSGRVLPGENEGIFGEGFVPRPNLVAERDRWYCYEFMVKANTPGERDGRVAFWVDGMLAGDFPNIRFRNVPELKIGHVVLGSYSSRRDANKTLWYDDVVIATSYIGPQAPAGPE